MSGPGHLSKDFFELVKAIGEAKSKQEEDAIIQREVGVLKLKMAKKGLSPKKMKEYLIRLIYVEMLGHDGSFGHIHAVKQVIDKNLLYKRVGYLSCSLFLHQDHEFMLLMINSIQSDLQSDNWLEVSMGLTVISRLVSKDLIPHLLPLVTRLLDHSQANIRKKAVVVMRRFYEIDSSIVSGMGETIRKVLCDKDPSVMGASLHLFDILVEDDCHSYKDLVPSFVSILKQIIEHRLPRDYDYHRMPAPWVQIQILRVLSKLGASDQKASEGMYEVLSEVIKRADIGINVGYAVVYECVRTITSIYPDSNLIEEAARAISRFISATNHNLKYLGINALASIVQINPKYAVEHQLVVIDCLEDKDETLKHKTLNLLYSMTNPANVMFIVSKLTDFLSSTVDVYLRTELVSRITELAEKFSPNIGWFIDTMNSVFELGGDLVKPASAHNLMKIISEGGDDTTPKEDDIRYYAVNMYLETLNKPILPPIILQVIAYVVGNFGYLSDQYTLPQIIDMIADVMEKPTTDGSTRTWFLTALMNLCARLPVGAPVPHRIELIVGKYQHSVLVDLQQRAHEFFELLQDRETMAAVLTDTSDIMDPDASLSFLNDFCNEALEAGAAPYSPPDDLEEEEALDYGAKTASTTAGLNFTPYEPTKTETASFVPQPSGGVSDPYDITATPEKPQGTLQLNVNRKKKVWGRKAAEPEPEPEPEPVHTYQAEEKAAPAAVEPTITPEVHNAAPARKRSLTEKEIMAQSLFAGLGGGATATTSASNGRGWGAKTTSAPPATAAPVPAPVSATPTPAPAQDIDILGDVFGNMTVTTPAPAPAAQHQPNASSDLDLLSGVFGDPAPVSSEPAGGLDFFGAALMDPEPEPQPVFEPQVMTTPQYGKLWKQYKGDVKLSVSPSSVTTPEEYMSRLSSNGVHPVQTIKIETICAAKHIATGTVVLLHGKILGGKVDVIVKSPSEVANQDAAAMLKSVLV